MDHEASKPDGPDPDDLHVIDVSDYILRLTRPDEAGEPGAVKIGVTPLSADQAATLLERRPSLPTQMFEGVRHRPGAFGRQETMNRLVGLSVHLNITAAGDVEEQFVPMIVSAVVGEPPDRLEFGGS